MLTLAIFPVTTVNNSTVFVVGVPYFGTVIAATLGTYDFGCENIIAAIIMAYPFSSTHLLLHHFKLPWRNNGWVAIFDIVLWNLTLVCLTLFC